MPTDKQIEASRANGARSRGPVTEDGKARSARKDPRKGLAQAVLLPGESRARFNELLEHLNEALQPETAIDHLMIGKMAASHWRQIRIWDQEKHGEKNLTDLEMRLDRQFCRSLDRYLKLRTLRNPRPSA